MMKLMRSLLIPMTCLSAVFLYAEESPYSLGHLIEFYDEFFCDEKQNLSASHVAAPCPISYWVSPNGNDANPGTESAPFLTLQRARDAVRALPTALRNQDITIFIEDGTYRLQEPLVLSSIDSGQQGHNVIYAAAPGAHPVISGAVQVTGWSLWDAFLGIYRAPVSSYQSRQLYVNGNRAVRAQTTPYPAGFLPNWTNSGPLNGGIEFIPTLLNSLLWFDPAFWTNPQDIEAVIVTQWKMMRVPLQSITPYSFPTNGLITVQQPAWDNANVYFDINTGNPGEWSFWQVTRFENALEFLDQPGYWYLDRTNHWIYYIPLPGEDMNTATVELPLLETLLVGAGTLEQPIHNIRFEGLTFSYATWLGPSSPDGYVSDQSAQLLLGSSHSSNFIGHDQNVVPTPGNISFTFASNIVFYGNIFTHLGAVGLQLGSGSHHNIINSNLFTDISSSAIEVGAVTALDAHPTNLKTLVQNNIITNNLITNVAAEYVDAAGIFVGFTKGTIINHNTIVNVPWSGIAIGWGWGLLDKGSFPGLPHAFSGEWGIINSPTSNDGCQILQNRIHSFLNVLWDGGAIYSTGQQGASLSTGLLIQGNVASGKRPDGGGNTFYTDGGSRYIRVIGNASYDNPIGITWYGPPPSIFDPLPYPLYSIQNNAPYGSDNGGCVTYGDIQYAGNYWLEAPIPANEVLYNNFYQLLLGFSPYSPFGFFAICPFTDAGISYPVNLSYQNNHPIFSKANIPNSLLLNAGVQYRPSTIPENLWVLPPP